MKTEIYTCDVCQKVKKDTNHWYTVALNQNGNIAIAAFDYDVAFDETWNLFEHCCGQECLLKAVARSLPKK